MNRSCSCRSTLQATASWIWAESVTYITAHGNTRPLTHWVRPGIEPASSCILVGLVTAVPQQELQTVIFSIPLTLNSYLVHRHLNLDIFITYTINPCLFYFMGRVGFLEPKRRLYICLWSVLSFFFFLFLAALGHREFLGQGWNLSHSCDLYHSCSNAGSFYPLCQALDQTCVLALQRCCQSHCTTAGMLINFIFT